MLKQKCIKMIFVLFVACLNLACLADDGLPSEREISNISHHEKFSLKQLDEMGVKIKIDFVDDETYFVSIYVNDPIRSRIYEKTSDINFSLFDKAGNFVIGMPSFVNERLNFEIQHGYKLRIMLVSESEFRGLKPKTGYYSDIDPEVMLKKTR